jgi:hypothetical protein
MSDTDQQLSTCGCCAGAHRATPAAVENLPGLSALAYRVGTHGSFKLSMQTALSGQTPLRELTTRDDDDPAIAALDGWATVLDVLSFYQERIANEGYLRTATERRSILELARSIGYELRPGVAAGTFLAFTLETAPGAPLSAKIAVGTKAQSTPAQDEKPQTFETVEEITGYAAWNQLKARQTEPVPPVTGTQTLYLKGTATNLKKGDAILIVGQERIDDPSSEKWTFRILTAVTEVPPPASIDTTEGYTAVTLAQPIGTNPAADNPRIYAMRQRASLFGYNAPNWRTMPESFQAGYMGLDPTVDAGLHNRVKDQHEWPDFNIAGISDPPPRTANGTGLYGEYFAAINLSQRRFSRTDATVDFNWGAGSPDPRIPSDNFSARWTGWVQPKVTGVHTFHVMGDDGVRLWVNDVLIIDQWQDNPGTEFSEPSNTRLVAGEKYDIKLEYFEHGGSAAVRLSWSATGLAKEVIPTANLFPRDIFDIHLDTTYPKIAAGGWTVLSLPGAHEVYSVEEVGEDSRALFALSGKLTHLKLRGERLRDLFNERIRDTAIFAQSEELAWGERPIAAPLSGNQLLLNGKVDGLFAGQFISVTGNDSSTGKPTAEVATIDSISLQGGRTRLILKQPLAHSYERTSTAINGNVARATHGDTKNEVMGSGDGASVFQKFALKQKPLTFVSAATPSGAETTLEVRINDILWHERPNFYQLPPNERAYVTRIADDGTVTVQFGDGVTGARLPTGSENVSAKYRVGIGLEGMLAANQLNLLMSRPLGLKEVTNPTPPTGAEDPEKLDQARANAPLTVLTLERIVSLPDFEDFSRAFGGIGKAQATWLWDGETRLVHLTIAGADGSSVPANSDLFKNLQDAVNGSRHTDQKVKIDSYTSRRFELQAKLLIDPDYLFDLVQAAVLQALTDAFSFARRAFGQAVTASEIIATAQSVAGVTAVDLDKLYFEGLTPAWHERLPANVAHWELNQVKPAELLTVNPEGILLTEMNG